MGTNPNRNPDMPLTKGREMSDNDQITELKRQLAVAQAGLLRATEFRTATPEGLNIKADVREALRVSGFRASLGTVGSLLPDLPTEDEARDEMMGLCSYLGAGTPSPETPLAEIARRVRWGVDHFTKATP